MFWLYFPLRFCGFGSAIFFLICRSTVDHKQCVLHFIFEWYGSLQIKLKSIIPTLSIALFAFTFSLSRFIGNTHTIHLFLFDWNVCWSLLLFAGPSRYTQNSIKGIPNRIFTHIDDDGDSDRAASLRCRKMPTTHTTDTNGRRCF